MGDIKRFKKKYTTPMHPWNATRIKLERAIRSKYGTGNKREIWKMESTLKSFKDQAKMLLTRQDEQANREREQLKARMARLSLIKKDGGIDDILSLQLRDIMNRRLQTIVLKRKMARTVKHARQMIVHEHITVAGKKITSPSYLVLAEEEAAVSFSSDSPYMQEGHAEAYNEEIAQRKAARAKAKGKRDGQDDNIIVFDTVEDPEEHAADSEVDASVGDLKVDEPAEEEEAK